MANRKQARSLKVRSSAHQFIKPPVDARTPPEGFFAPNTADFRGSLPKQGELAVMRDSVGELLRFTGYSDVFGRTAPPYELITAAFDAASAWSHDRHATAAWLTYSVAQEGIAWKGMRKLLTDLKVCFDLAATRDPALLAQYPSLTRLFGVNGDIAKRAASTRKRSAKGNAPSAPVAAPAEVLAPTTANVVAPALTLVPHAVPTTAAA